MDTDNHHSVTFSISHKNMNCDTIIEYLKKSGIMASVTSNKSIICIDDSNKTNKTNKTNKSNKTNKKCFVEQGCRILFNNVSKKSIRNYWQDIKNIENLTCAHIEIPSLFSGCIYDYVDDTKCPGQTQKN